MENSDRLFWLETESDTVAKRRFQLAPGETVVFGRDNSCQVQIKDATVSRYHAEIQWVEDAFQLQDLDSSNGTHVNGFAIEQVELHVGDKIKIGDSTFVFGGPTTERAPRQDDGIRCEHCGRWVPSPLAVCPGCGAPTPTG